MPQALTAVKGMNDILPPHSEHWQWLQGQVQTLMRRFAYRQVRTPIVEHTQLFVRGIGEATDIVEKEMYSFEDHLNGERLTLRPEGTASLVRAAAQHNLLYDGGKRLWYMGPMFRHERPQRGRYRQFHQIGAEALGFPGPDVDAEIILLAAALLRQLGITQWRLELNSLGQPPERQAHRAALVAHLNQHYAQLDAQARARLHTNPLRVLDSKNPALQDIANTAPRLLDYLGKESLAHLDGVKTMLDACGVPWVINPRLVRGLDYYNLTVFEFVTDLLGAQGTLCAGGRYDYLMEQISGKSAPAVGWALGVERVLEVRKELGHSAPGYVPDAYAIVQDAAALPTVLHTLQHLRAAGVQVQMHPQGSASGAQHMASLKAQFKKANASGARFALIFGQEEVQQGQVAIKPMHDTDGPLAGQQRQHRLADVAQWAPGLRAL